MAVRAVDQRLFQYTYHVNFSLSFLGKPKAIMSFGVFGICLYIDNKKINWISERHEEIFSLKMEILALCCVEGRKNCYENLNVEKFYWGMWQGESTFSSHKLS